MVSQTPLEFSASFDTPQNLRQDILFSHLGLLAHKKLEKKQTAQHKHYYYNDSLNENH